MKTGKIKVNFGFGDDTTRPLEMGPFASDAAVIDADTLRTKAKAFDPATVKDLFVSDAGSSCTGIVTASINIVEEREINLNVG